jgi:hypothetical protein
MHDRERKVMQRLLERLRAARSRRDREERFSEPWRAADAEMHVIERAIFRMPLDASTDGWGGARGGGHRSTVGGDV